MMNLFGYSDDKIAIKLEVILLTIEKNLHHMRCYCIKWSKEIVIMGCKKQLLNSTRQLETIQREL